LELFSINDIILGEWSAAKRITFLMDDYSIKCMHRNKTKIRFKEEKAV
jgi:hypothetical protein